MTAGATDGGAATLRALAAGAFLLLVASLAGPIAPMGITTAITGALTLACFVRPPRPQRPMWPRTPLDAAALGWLAALVIVSACALDRAGSFPRVAKGFMPLLVGLAAFHAADATHGRRALAVYFAAFALVSAIGLSLWVVHGASFASRARGLAGHYMTFAGQLLLFIPVALGVALTARAPRWRWAAAAVALLAFAPLAATFTRSAWLGLFVACAVLLGATRPLGLVALAVLGVAAWFLAPGAWGARLHSVVDPANLWNQQRVYMWEAGVRMFHDHPLTGVGLQDLHALYDQYRSPDSVERAGHLHNAYVQIAASMGLVGLAAFAWLYASLLRTAWAGVRVGARGTRAERGSEAEALAAGVRIGVTAALVGFLVAGLFEWNFGDEELLYHLYTLVGIAWASRQWTDVRL
jgi:O-antigen ligase